jgi:septum formation protein
MDLILASTSPIRGTLLANAGVPYGVAAPAVDEATVKQGFAGDDAALATRLAELKSLSVAKDRTDALVIGSDSVLSVEGRRFSKPGGREEAAEHLRFFSGKEMLLTSAVALARGERVVWSHADQARLQCRVLSDGFIERYLDGDWPEVSYCVGVFRLEGPGIQLFERIDGDHFTIQGMPLLPLTGELRRQGVLAA